MHRSLLELTTSRVLIATGIGTGTATGLTRCEVAWGDNGHWLDGHPARRGLELDGSGELEEDGELEVCGIRKAKFDCSVVRKFAEFGR